MKFTIRDIIEKSSSAMSSYISSSFRKGILLIALFITPYMVQAQDLKLTGTQQSSGAVGTTVDIIGSGFGTSVADFTITFIPVDGSNETQTLADALNGNILSTTVPAGLAGGNYHIQVERISDNSTSTTSNIYSVVNSGGSFMDSNTGITALTRSPSDWGDFDGDGDLDLVITGQNSNYELLSTIYENEGGTFVDIGAGLAGVSDGSSNWGDYDGDGDLDLIITGQNRNGMVSKIYRNDDGSFTDINAVITGGPMSSSDWGDYDGDGDLDLIITGLDINSDRISKIYRNDDGTFTDINAAITGVYNGSSEWGDYDGDGDLDLIITGTGDNIDPSSKIYRNDGGIFTAISAAITDVEYSSSNWGDYDGDGDLDLIITGLSENEVVSEIYRNDNGTFTDINAGLTGLFASSSDWGDFDGDGDLDLIITGHDTNIDEKSKIYRNDGSNFTAINAGLTNVDDGSSEWGDYDEDGDLDIIITGEDTNGELVSTIYENNSAPVASSITISGDLTIGEELATTYDYSDKENDDEFGTTYQWYRADDDQGTDKTPIADADAQTYTLTADDFGKYINVEVTPNDSNTAGSPAQSNWLGPVHPFAGGSGTEADPYQIATAAQLDSVRHHLDSHFIQTADINLDIVPYNQDNGWMPIGLFNGSFVGSYDGGGHFIEGLFTTDLYQRIGLFYTVKGDIHNLKMTNVDIALVNGGALAYEVEDASLSNIEVSGKVSGYTFVGGLMGSYTTTSADSISDIKATITVESQNGAAGGIAGTVSGNVTISNIVSSQEVAGRFAGGVSGAVNNFSGSITNTYVTGVKAGGYFAGGFIGYKINGPLVIGNSYSTADVTGQTSAGGITGFIDNTSVDEPISINHSYATGSVEGNLTGGLIGRIDGTASTIDLSNSFWDTDSLGQISSVGDGTVNGTDGTALPITKMKRPDTYTDAGWDLDTIWEIKDPYAGSISYPRLRSIPEEPFPGLRDESVPIASNLIVPEDPEYKATLRAEYSFTDGDDDPDRSIIQWYRSDDAGGTNKQVIAGADSAVYTLTKADIHKYISVEVLPSDGYAEDDKMTVMVGEAQSPFDGGRGTEANPYQIATGEQLVYVRDFLDAHFIQTADIDLSEYNNWDPIGDSGAQFTGAYDGSGNLITGLAINRPAESTVGLFGYNSGEIHGIGLEVVTITGDNRVGALIGDNRGDVYESYTTGAVTGNGTYIGGLVGFHDGDGTITNTYSTVKVTGGSQVGGLVGATWNTAGLISYSWSSGEVSGSSSVGGIVGRDEASSGASGIFWNTESSGQNSSAIGTGKDIFGIKTKSTFSDANWDFDSVWQIDEPQDGSISYPHLQNNTQDPAPGYRDENAPVAEDVAITGTPDPGSTLEVTYTYTDADGDPETGTEIQWYRSNDDLDANKTPIDGATSETYTITDEDVCKFISVEVTPGDGYISGETVTASVGQGNAPFAGGCGTVKNPFQIATADQLDNVRDYLGSHFIQTADIDLDLAPYNQGDGWEPILSECIREDEFSGECMEYEYFSGSYDGNNHTIQNLFIDRPNGYPTDDRKVGVGLFARIDEAKVKNLHIHEADVIGKSKTGILAGYIRGDEFSVISVSGTVQGNQMVGGFSGTLYRADVSQVYANVEVTSRINDSGGLSGNISEVTVTNSYATGSVTSTNDSDRIGGFFGSFVAHGDAQDNQAHNNYAAVEVNSDGNDVGGFAGNLSVTGDTDFFGNFWDTDSSGTTYSAFGQGRSLFDMKTKPTFSNAGWDFDAVWQIDEPQNGSISYPYLRNNPQDPPPGYRIENLPVAKNVEVAGEPEYKATLEASYTYTDADGDPEAGTIVQWYRSDDENGTNKEAIHGGGSLTYHLTKADLHKYISFEVTPDDGIARGETVSIMVGEAQSPFDGGRGTETNPYQIATVEQLDYVREFLDVHFIQTADIDMDVPPYNQNGWKPLGSFSGVYDGNNYTISNLSISSGDFYVGLFASIKNEVKNLTLKNIEVTGSGSYIGGLTGALLGDLENIRVSGEITASHNTIGGIAGLFTEGTASSVHSSVNLTGTNNTGGLFGMVELEDKIEIMESSFTGTIASNFSAGGFIGRNRKSNSAPVGSDGIPIITNSYFAGTIDADWAGGFIGIDDETARITNSYSVGAITSEDQHAGGIAGSGGKKTYDSIENLYVAAKITGNTTGALFGEVQSPVTVTNVYWDSEATTQPSASGSGTLSGATVLKRFEMRTPDSFTGFDFGNTWQIDEVESGYISYPYLTSTEVDSIPGRIKVDPPTLSNSYNQQYLSATKALYETEVTKNGNMPVNERGLTWSLSNDFSGDTVMVQHTNDGLGVYADTLKNLPPYTTIYLRGYAKNPVGTSFGKTISFQTKKQLLSIIGHFSAANKVYDGDRNAEFDKKSLKLDSVYTEHDVQLDNLKIEFADKDIAKNIGVTITEADLSGTQADKYQFSLDGAPTSAAEITPRPITITADTQSVEYGNPNPDLTYKITSGSLVEGERISGDIARTGNTNIGNYIITKGTLTLSDNYNLTFEPAPFTITPRTLTVVADTLEKTFGETDPDLTYEVSGFAYYEDESILTGNLTRKENESVGTYDITPGDLSAGDNYTIDYTGAEFIIEGKELVVTVDEDLSKVYGEKDPTLSYSASGFEFGDDSSILTGSLSRDRGEDAGQYAITAGNLSAGDNYQINLKTDSLKILPKRLAVSAKPDQFKIYGDTDSNILYNATGFAFDDDATLFDGTLSREEGEDVGTYETTIGDLTAGPNYEIDFTATDFTITPKTLTIAADSSQSKVYGSVDKILTYSVKGYELQDDASILTGSLKRAPGEDVGTYAISQGNLSANDNYSIDYTSADFTITSKQLTVKADKGQQKIYGETDPDLTYTTSGFVFDEDESILIGDVKRSDGETVGTYPITQGDLSAGDNYTIDYSGANFIIKGKELLVTVDENLSKIYGEKDPNLTYSASGFESGDDSSILIGSLSRDRGEGAGKYEINLGDLSAGDNYSISINTDSLEILPKTLSVTARPDQSKVYGDAEEDILYNTTGFAFDDDSTLFDGALSREEGEDVGSYEITLGDLSPGQNYNIDFASATYEILPETLRVVADTGLQKFEGDSEPTLTFKTSGFKLDDDENILTGSLSREKGESPGEYEITQGDLSAGDNYKIDFSGADFSILRTPPRITKVSPGEDTNQVAIDTDIEIIYNKKITLADKELISVVDESGTEIPTSSSIQSDTLRLAISSPLAHLTNYTVTVDAGAVQNLDAIDNEAFEWNFTTIIAAPEMVTTSTPEDETNFVPLQPDFSWEEAARASEYTIQLATAASFNKGALTINKSGLTTLAFEAESHLERNATYFWRVRAENTGGAGSWSDTFSFTTIPHVPEQVVLASPNDNRGSVKTDTPLVWETADGATAYQLQVAANQSFTEDLITREDLSETSQSLTNELQDNSTYFWRVQASNSGGMGDWSQTWSFTTRATAPTLSFPSKDEEEISIAPRFSWNSGYEDSQYRLRVSKDNNFANTITDTLVGTEYIKLNGLATNTTYYWQVRIETESNTSPWSPTRAFTTRMPPQEDPVDEQIVFGDSNSGGQGDGEQNFDAFDYRLVGLPGSNSTPVDELFDGEYGRDWKVFEDNGAQSDFLVEHSEDNPLTFAAGKGYWVLSKNPVTIDGSIPSVEVSKNDTYAISLTPGWNIISNPFNRAADWQQIKEFNAFDATLYSYEGSFSTASKMEPFTAYYVYNDAGGELNLEIPFTSLDKRGAQRNKSFGKLDIPKEISLTVANQDREIQSDIRIAYPVDAKQRQKANSYHPPLELSKFGVSFVKDENQGRQKLFQQLGGVYNTNRKHYKVVVKSTERQHIHWTARLSGLDESAGVLVVDAKEGRAQILQQKDKYSYMAEAGQKTFDVYVGTTNELNEIKDNLIPNEFTLNQNYPNPFNPTTTIRFGLQERGPVQLEVFDILGRKVQTLVDETRSAGWHNVRFDARRLASGTYFYRLIIGQKVKTNKMMLIK